MTQAAARSNVLVEELALVELGDARLKERAKKVIGLSETRSSRFALDKSCSADRGIARP
jgi:hypothetical protein